MGFDGELAPTWGLLVGSLGTQPSSRTLWPLHLNPAQSPAERGRGREGRGTSTSHAWPRGGTGGAQSAAQTAGPREGRRRGLTQCLRRPPRPEVGVLLPPGRGHHGSREGAVMVSSTDGPEPGSPPESYDHGHLCRRGTRASFRDDFQEETSDRQRAHRPRIHPDPGRWVRGISLPLSLLRLVWTLLESQPHLFPCGKLYPNATCR